MSAFGKDGGPVREPEKQPRVHGLPLPLHNPRRLFFFIVTTGVTSTFLELLLGDLLGRSVAGPFTLGMLLLTLQGSALIASALWYVAPRGANMGADRA